MTIRIQEELSVRGHFRYHDSIGLLSAAGPGFSGPYSIALGSDNLLYVANRANPNQTVNTWTSSPNGAKATASTLG